MAGLGPRMGLRLCREAVASRGILIGSSVGQGCVASARPGGTRILLHRIASITRQSYRTNAVQLDCSVRLPLPRRRRRINALVSPGVTSQRLLFSTFSPLRQHEAKRHSTTRVDATSSAEAKESPATSHHHRAPRDRNDEPDRLGQYEPQKLSEDIMTAPNVLTMLRLASTPLLGYLVVVDEMKYALALLVASGFTDALDGYLARRYGSATVFGSIADPAADKALMTVMVGALAWRGLIPVPLVVLIIGRDVALVVSAFLIRYRSLPEPKTLQRYFDPRLPSAKVLPTQVSKYNTLLQIVLVGICTLLASLSDDWRQWWAERRGLWRDTSCADRASDGNESSRTAMAPSATRDMYGDVAKKTWHAFQLIVSATTIWSGASYLSGSGAVNVVSSRMRKSAVVRRVTETKRRS